MTDAIPAQVEASPSPLPDQIWAGVRQIAPALTAYGLGRGWLSGDTATLLAVIGGMMWPIIAGQLKTRRRAIALATIAADPRVPDDVCKLKGA